MNCNAFRAGFAPGSSDAAILDHLRSCDGCLDHAAHVDPDVMFRALGGAEIVPPGGLDPFVADVMRAVQLRVREGQIDTAAPTSWSRRLAIAATLAIGISSAALVYRVEQRPVDQPVVRLARATSPVTAVRTALTTKPVVETYSSPNATIVEVPNGSTSDVQVVMIFDESLPADL
jgi:hypothetical protein